MTALIFLALAQAPTDVPVAIVVSSRRDAANAAPAMVEQLKVALAGQGISAMGDADSVARIVKLGGVDPKACDAARLCLQKLAQLIQGVVIGVDVSKAGKLTAAHLEAVAYDRVESLAADDFTSSEAKQWSKKAGEAALVFAQKLKEPISTLNVARATKPESTRTITAQTDSKGAPALEPPPEPSPKLVPEPPPQPPAQQPQVVVAAKGDTGPVPYVTTGAAILLAGGGIVLMILGFLDRGKYFETVSGTFAQGVSSSFTDTQLHGLASASNAKLGVGGTLLGLAGALGITSAVLFMKE